MIEDRYFSFGDDHVLPDGSPAGGRFVVVRSDRNHRDLFMAWLGSNRFAFEYDEDDWETLRGNVFSDLRCARMIEVRPY